MYCLIKILILFVSKFWFFFFEILTFFRKLRLSRMYLSPIFVRRVCRWFWRATRGDNQARYDTLWLVHHGLPKKRHLNEARYECQGYTRGSKARLVFPSTFSFSPCLEFPRQECRAGIWLVRYGPLKKWDLNEARHERRGYTRGSKAMRVFPSTFSLLPWVPSARVYSRHNDYNYHLIIMMVSIPYRYHLIGMDTFRYLQVWIPFDTYKYRNHINTFNITSIWVSQPSLL